MRRALTVVVVFLLALSAFGQEPSGCVIQCDGDLSSKSFTIPLGAVYSAICALFPEACVMGKIAEIVAGTLIPSIQVKFKTQVTIKDIMLEFSPDCPCPCPEGKLYARPHIEVVGTAELPGVVPVGVYVIGHIVGPEIEDGGQNDKNPNPCAISNFEGFKFSIEDFGVSLVFLDNFTLNVDEEEAIFSGTVSAAVTSTPCKVLYGCKPFEENKPPMVVAPRKYKVPVGLKTMIPIGVYDPNDDPVYVWYALNYGGIESHLDYDQDEKIYYLTIRVPEDYSGWEELELTVHVYDLRRGVSVEPPNLPNPGDYYHMVPGRISLKIVRNQPPQAISQEMELPCPNFEFGCSVPVIFAATDPDLPEGNFGYDLYFVPGSTEWDCGWRFELSPWLDGLSALIPSCAKEKGRCELKYSCVYIPCTWFSYPQHPIPPGIYKFPFSVVEYNPWKGEYGFVDHGVWTLRVTAGQPLTLTLSSSEIMVVFPGERKEVTVTATDPEGGWLTLEKVSGPGKFRKREGKETVSGTWTWTVPKPYSGSSWELVKFKATDACGESRVAYLAVYIPPPWPPQPLSGSVWVGRGATAQTNIYVQDLESFPHESHEFSFKEPEGISVEVVGQQTTRDEDEAWGGLFYEVEVLADRTVCPGEYQVPFTVTDREGNSGQATLTIHVQGNQPPQVSDALIRGTATVTLTPEGVVCSPVVMRTDIWDPEGDRVSVEGHGLSPAHASNLSMVLGSLVMMYFSDAANYNDYCRAVREKDVIVDYFTVPLRDSCGAETEVPVEVVIQVEDKAPPDLKVPADVDLGCNPQDTSPDATGWATATDNCDPNPQVTYTDEVSQEGCRVIIKRTWRAQDASENEAKGVQRITYIADTQSPVLVVPGDETVECHQVPPLGVATATDNCDPNPQVEYVGEERVDGPCPYTYTLIRTWRAADACGNAVEKSQRITVRDTTPPVLTRPGNVNLGCNPSDTSPDVTGWATATDNCDPNPTVTYTDSLSTVGCTMTITRIWNASDACGNTTQCIQLITYTADTVPPTIHCPDRVWRSSSEPPGSLVWVTYPITASDACDPSPTLSCSPAGGYFRVGEAALAHTSCTAWDACGNETTRDCAFWVIVEFVCPPLIAQPDSADAPGHVWIPVLANDSGYGLRIVGVSPPTCGSAWPSGDGIVYTTMGWSPECPPPTMGMQETFSYIVEDACGNQASAAVTVTITCDICPLSVPGGKEEK